MGSLARTAPVLPRSFRCLLPGVRRSVLVGNKRHRGWGASLFPAARPGADHCWRLSLWGDHPLRGSDGSLPVVNMVVGRGLTVNHLNRGGNYYVRPGREMLVLVLVPPMACRGRRRRRRPPRRPAAGSLSPATWHLDAFVSSQTKCSSCCLACNVRCTAPSTLHPTRGRLSFRSVSLQRSNG